MPTVVVGTAGHIDHGKTSLLRALTGIDADRLPEERARGMTIDVGYAHLAFDDGVELDFVDVPGHERLVGNMLVGAGEIDAAMLVVAADDGPRPQTLEHLAIIDALGVTDGLAVVTKTDLVDRARVEEVRERLQALLAESTLASVPVLDTSAATGEGIGSVLATLRRVRDAVLARRRLEEAGARAEGPLRLAIDRVFTVKGRGVVVTGTLRGGSVMPGAILRREPGGELVRVREVQVHGEPRERHDGGRTALSLAGIEAEAVRRGDVLTNGPRVRGTDRILAHVRRPSAMVGPLAWPPKHGSRLRLHLGTDQVEAGVRRPRDAADVVLLDLARPTATFPGDRAVVREPAQGQVVAGVRVLDTTPPRGASRRRMTPGRLEALLAAVAAGSVDDVQASRIALHGALASEVGDGGQPTSRSMALAGDVAAELSQAAIEAVAAHHRESRLSPGLPLPRARAALLRRLRSLATIERRHADAAGATIERLIDDLVATGRLARRGDVLRDPARGEDVPEELAGAMDRLEAALAVAAPPGLGVAAEGAGCPPDGVRALQAAGRIVRVEDDLAWATPTFHRLAALALEMARREPLSPAALRDAMGSSRRYALAILEDLDRREVLARTPEGHIPGPRAPRPPLADGRPA